MSLLERVSNLAFSEGGAFWFDQLRSQLRGADPEILAEWSEIIEKKSKRACNDSTGARIIFRGVVDEERRFTLDVDASDPGAMLSLLKSIQDSLDLMPAVPKLFYSTVMGALASEAEEKGKLDTPWHLSA
jgi:hypothetical protein